MSSGTDELRDAGEDERADDWLLCEDEPVPGDSSLFSGVAVWPLQPINMRRQHTSPAEDE
jgi:hypothetical protein